MEPVSADAAFGVFRENLDRLQALLGAPFRASARNPGTPVRGHSPTP